MGVFFNTREQMDGNFGVLYVEVVTWVLEKIADLS